MSDRYTPSGRYPFGSRVRYWFRRQESPVTVVLLGVLVLMFLLEFIPGVTGALVFSPVYLLYPGAETSAGVSPFPFEPWRLVTSIFLHSTAFPYLHIIFNGYALWILGRQLEPLIGARRFLALFLISGLGGSVGVVLLAPINQFVFGASGAVFGLMGAFFVILRASGINSPQVLIVIGINLLIGFLPGFNVAWQAHVGGLAVGALIGWIYSKNRYGAARRRVPGYLTAVVGGLIAVAAVRMFLYL